MKSQLMVRFTKFEKWLNQQDSGHLDLYKFVTLSSYKVAKKNSEKFWDIRISKFVMSFSTGKVNISHKLGPCHLSLLAAVAAQFIGAIVFAA